MNMQLNNSKYMSTVYKWINMHILKEHAGKCFNCTESLEAVDITQPGHSPGDGKAFLHLTVHDSMYLFEEHSQLSSLNSPARTECISCPRRNFCARVWQSTRMWAQKPQDAINGPLRMVPSTVKCWVALSLQIILNPSYLLHTLKHTKPLKSNFICVYWEGQNRYYHPLFHVRKEIQKGRMTSPGPPS